MMGVSLLTRWRKAFTTDADGNSALRTVMSGDQTLSNLTMTGDLELTGGGVIRADSNANQLYLATGGQNIIQQ